MALRLALAAGFFSSASQGSSFPALLETSGGLSPDVVTMGHFCGEENQALVASISKQNGTLSLFGGPTPHVLYQTDFAQLINASFLTSTMVTPNGKYAELWAGNASGSVSVLRFTAGGAVCQDIKASLVAHSRVLQSIHRLTRVGSRGSEVVLAVSNQNSNPKHMFSVLSLDSEGQIIATTTQLDLSILPNSTFMGLASFASTAAPASPTLLAAVQQVVVSSEVQLEVLLNPLDAAPTSLAKVPVVLPAGAGPVIDAVFFHPFDDSSSSESDNTFVAPLLAIICSDSTVLLYNVDVTPSSPNPLVLMSSDRLDPAYTGNAPPPTRVRAWKAAAAGSLIASSSSSSTQLLVVREANSSSLFDVSVLVFGSPSILQARTNAIGHTLGQQEYKATFNDSATNAGNLTYPVDEPKLLSMLRATHTNTFNADVCDCPANASDPHAWGCSQLNKYSEFVSLLIASDGFQVDGHQLRIWMGIFPPSEVANIKCVPPHTDDPRTAANETAIFAGKTYLDYDAWGTLAGQLAAQFNHLVAINIDDMSINVDTVFAPPKVALITANMRTHAPWLCLASTIYYSQAGQFVWDRWPDFPLALDAPVFYFRNQKQGAGPCAAPDCVWGPLLGNRTKGGGCLAGSCADSTVLHAVDEVREMARGVPAGRALQTAFYSTGHSTLGQPSALYTNRMLQLLLSLLLGGQEQIGGVTVYTLKAPQRPCLPSAAPLFGGDEGCIVQNAFAAGGLVRGEH